jgi:hypothetical protein
MLLNLIGFNISWFGLILLGNTFIPFTLFWIGIHIYCCKQWLNELKLIISVTLIGIFVDSTLSFFDVLLFSEQLLTTLGLIPLWLITLWAAFASTIAHSLQFLAPSKILQFTMGFIFPPLSYIGGYSLLPINFGHDLLMTYFILAPIWGVLMVLFFYLKEKAYAQVEANV